MRKNNFEFIILNFELNAWQAKDEGRLKKNRRWEEEPAADGGALQASLFELRPDKSLEV